ncbi:hypothetical protein COCCU_13120 [Corynebacterium occultum]|uniref:Chain length determinant protein n=1 Tax=Corynebacterium occultum TaxID=2675219 RepID=A0A6B8VWL0_9CORY|nr:hypothetical protein [Corynebacterium occultum]QGU08523.1 hypothetical protein COCCU_13120 [Corynebacterium occultum]
MSDRNPPVPAPLNLGLIFTAFRRALPAALLAALLTGGITAAALTQVPEEYEVSTQLSLGHPGDIESDPEILANLVPLFSQMISDNQTREAVQETTGVAEPKLSSAETSVAGVVTLNTRGESETQAKAIADAVVASLQTRGTQIYNDSIAALETETNRQTEALREQINQRRAADPEADVSELETAILIALEESRAAGIQNIQPMVLSQSDNAGQAVWPLPLATSLVAALLALLLVDFALGIWFLRRRSRADSLWLRSLGQRLGADTELAHGGNGLTPKAEARAAAALSRGKEVLILGDVELGDAFHAYEEDRIHTVSWRDRWWREVSPAALGLGIVVIEQGDKQARHASIAADRLTESGVPTYVALRSKKRNEK